MKLYHGSTFIVKEPNIEILNYRTDFGKGFYTTTDIEQAKKWTKIKKERLEQEMHDFQLKRYINIYEYNEDKNLKILNFIEATEEWLDFVYKNRSSNELLHDYDIVKGPVANDNLFATLRLYERNFISKKTTIEELKTYKLVDQISFHTAEALKTLKYIETEEVE
ncbi:MAG: DUF3990 domain-containing protein [Clostridia bacterium]|nr:DUF3990 domain-containing protein [Clostridia bacterium]